jgi:hypothetical protein
VLLSEIVHVHSWPKSGAGFLPFAADEYEDYLGMVLVGIIVVVTLEEPPTNGNPLPMKS